jgi:hypothetical protein
MGRCPSGRLRRGINDTQMTPFLYSYAVGYGRLGLPIFPIQERGKEPACSNGVHDATPNLDRIHAWWGACNNLNIGLACGGGDTSCGNWTKSGDGSAIVGHHDRTGLKDTRHMNSWNSSDGSRGCSQDNLKSTGGAGLIYCFLAN